MEDNVVPSGQNGQNTLLDFHLSTMQLENPTLIHPGPKWSVPLFLLHDGGGTIFNYFMLGDMKRPVYGIQDPKFGTEAQWPGGMDEMARLYISYIRSVVSQGPFLLGGWSLGGFVSLEIAGLLAAEPSPIRVAGIIMIDSPFPEHWPEYRDRYVDADFSVNDTTSAKTKQAVDWRMDECDRILESWKVPRWTVSFLAFTPPFPPAGAHLN